MTQLIINLTTVALSGLLWRLGGAEGFSKGFRRIGCACAIITANLIAGNWLALASLPLLIGAFSLGYGINSRLIKLFKNKYIVRAICGLAYSMASLFILWGNWWALGFHMIIVTIGVTAAGTQKFKQIDIKEEGLIGLLVAIMPVMAG